MTYTWIQLNLDVPDREMPIENERRKNQMTEHMANDISMNKFHSDTKEMRHNDRILYISTKQTKENVNTRIATNPHLSDGNDIDFYLISSIDNSRTNMILIVDFITVY